MLAACGLEDTPASGLFSDRSKLNHDALQDGTMLSESVEDHGG